MSPDTQMGALISEEHLHKVLEYVNIGRNEVRLNTLKPSVRYISQQSYLRLRQPAVSLVVITRPQMANLAKTHK